MLAHPPHRCETAKILDLTFPLTLLGRSDDVVENKGLSWCECSSPLMARPGGSLQGSKSSVIESAADHIGSRRVLLSMTQAV
jgi:hypothetical protein